MKGLIKSCGLLGCLLPWEMGREVLSENLQWKKSCQILTPREGKGDGSNFAVGGLDQHCLRQVAKLTPTMTSRVGSMYTCHHVVSVVLHPHGFPRKDPIP